ncbi:MAG: M48 family metalloprotease [Alphaproteobacteria bacterium]
MRAILRIRQPFMIAAALLGAALASPASSQQSAPGFVRDAEVENILRVYAAPLFRAAGFEPNAIRLHLIADKSLNAFVANGLNIYFHTGLLVRADDASQVIGVMAHELGHITGGHLARTEDRIRQAQNQSIATFLLGAGAAILTGRGDAAAAVIAGGQNAVMASFLQYSQTQESSADQAGLKFMDAAGVSARGLGEFLRVLENQELLAVGRQDPYMRSHPVTRQRIDTVEAQVARSPYADAKLPPTIVEMHKRMRVKLAAFLDPVPTVLQRHPESDTSIVNRYARAIGLYRKPDLPAALATIDGLLAQEPKNPYFHELRGQMLFENGKAAEAVEPLQTAVRLLPDNALLKVLLSQVLIETNDQAAIRQAIVHLEEARKIEDDNLSAVRFLAIAYGRDGQLAMAALSQAEFALATGRNSEAKVQADKALQGLKSGSPAWLRAQDLKSQAESRSKANQ